MTARAAIALKLPASTVRARRPLVSRGSFRGRGGRLIAPGSSASHGPTHKPFAAFSRSAMSLRDSLVALARAQVGTKYVHGGETPDHGFDCSGLVRYIVAALHIVVPRTAAKQAFAGIGVPMVTAIAACPRAAADRRVPIIAGNWKMNTLRADAVVLARDVRERCDSLVSLPMRGQVGSLNASASVAAALYGWVLPAHLTDPSR